MCAFCCLKDCGQVMPGAVIVVVRMDGVPSLCKTDEVGEICVNSSASGSGYWGLQGLTNQVHKIERLLAVKITVYRIYGTKYKYYT